jgi:3-phenylpropionate/trans-cinnamate dioxygenase ferredoxin subunit
MSLSRVCSLSDIPSDTNVLGTEVDGEPVAIVRDEDGRVHAVSNVCSHQYVLLSEGEVEDCAIECWLHGSRFDLRTGRPTGLPATQPIDVFDVRVDGDDVLVDVTARPTDASGPAGSGTSPSQAAPAHASKEN